ncbi:MAG: hypothetical protein JSR41_09900 [Proteobacteria bacterium]|nr:hypothetical protein [Pseudomonadota bacterium]
MMEVSVRIFLSAVSLCALAACAAPPASRPASTSTEAEWAAQIRVNADPYTKVTTIRGASIKSGQSSLQLTAARSDRDTGVEPKLVFYASIFYSSRGWAMFDSANSIDGRSWPTKSVRRDVLSCASQICSYGELVLVDVDSAYLRSKIADGVNLKIWGPGGEQVFVIPGAYISAFLAEVPAQRP